jgi:hypothetical protein
MHAVRRIDLALILSATIFVGCQASTRPTMPGPSVESKLRDIAELCRVYQKVHNAPPRKISDLSRGGNQATPGAFAAIQSGSIVLRLEAPLVSTEKEPGKPESDLVLAYEKQVPTQGGWVLMLDRRIRTMTAAEFKAAKLAGNGSD